MANSWPFQLCATVIYLLLIYSKNEQEDLTPEQLKLLRKTVEAEFK